MNQYFGVLEEETGSYRLSSLFYGCHLDIEAYQLVLSWDYHDGPRVSRVDCASHADIGLLSQLTIDLMFFRYRTYENQ